MNFTANGGAKFDPTQHTITTGATVTTALHTTNEAKTTMSCTISLSKTQSTTGVTISGLPAGTTYTVEESPETGWKYIKTDYAPAGTANQSIASGETETATITNAKTNSLKLTLKDTSWQQRYNERHIQLYR